MSMDEKRPSFGVPATDPQYQEILSRGKLWPGLFGPDWPTVSISAGEITLTGPGTIVEAESNADSDTLETVNGGKDGHVYLVRPVSGRTITIAHGTGNIVCIGDTDIILENEYDLCELMPIRGIGVIARFAAGGGTSVSHNAVTLAASAATILDISVGQELSLDTQTANRVWAGPTTGAAATPTFRALVAADVTGIVTWQSSLDAGDTFRVSGDAEPRFEFRTSDGKLYVGNATAAISSSVPHIYGVYDAGDAISTVNFVTPWIHFRSDQAEDINHRYIELDTGGVILLAPVAATALSPTQETRIGMSASAWNGVEGVATVNIRAAFQNVTDSFPALIFGPGSASFPFIIDQLPTSDLSIAYSLWNSSGIVVVSGSTVLGSVGAGIGNWKSLHTNGSATVAGVALGAAGTFYRSAGAAAAPTWAALVAGDIPDISATYVAIASASWVDLTDGGGTTLHSHATQTSTLLDGAVHTDTLAGSVADGDTIIGNVTPKWSRLAIAIPAANVRNVLGIDNAELRPSWKTALDSTDPAALGVAAPGTSLVFSHRDHVHLDPVTAHAAAADPHAGYLLESLYDAKGDLITASADNTPSKLTVGADDTILMADAAAAGGLKWVASASPSAVGTAAVTGTADTFTRGDHVHAMGVITTKGDILTWSTLPLRLAVGTDGQVLTADAASAGGIKWAASAGGGSVATDAIWDALGDTVYATGADAAVKLAGNITTTPKYLRQVGNGAVSAAPAWTAIPITELTGANWSLFPTNGSGVPTALTNGAASTVLAGTSATGAPVWTGSPQLSAIKDTGGTTRITLATTAAPGPNVILDGATYLGTDSTIIGTTVAAITTPRVDHILYIAGDSDEPVTAAGRCGIGVWIGQGPSLNANTGTGIAGKIITVVGATSNSVYGLNFSAGISGASASSHTIQGVRLDMAMGGQAASTATINGTYVQCNAPSTSSTATRNVIGFNMTTWTNNVATAKGFVMGALGGAATILSPLELGGLARTTDTDGSFHRMNMQFGSATRAFATGDGVIGIANVTTAPSTTPASGVVLYATDAQRLMMRGAYAVNEPLHTSLAALAAGTAYASSTTETALNNAVFNFPANSLVAGAVYRVTARGVYSDTLTPTFQMRVRWGGVAGVLLGDSGAVVMGISQTSLGWHVEFLIRVVSIGATGTVECQGEFSPNTTAILGTFSHMPNTAVITIDSTAAKDLVLTGTWSANSASNTLTVRQFVVERIG